MRPIVEDLNDSLLRRQAQDLIDRCGNDPELLRRAATTFADSYVEARIAAKWFCAQSAAQGAA